MPTILRRKSIRLQPRSAEQTARAFAKEMAQMRVPDFEAMRCPSHSVPVQIVAIVRTKAGRQVSRSLLTRTRARETVGRRCKILRQQVTERLVVDATATVTILTGTAKRRRNHKTSRKTTKRRKWISTVISNLWKKKRSRRSRRPGWN